MLRGQTTIDSRPLMDEASTRMLTSLNRPVGPWRSWERASMASRRSWVRIPSAPPNVAAGKGACPTTCQCTCVRRTQNPIDIILFSCGLQAFPPSGQLTTGAQRSSCVYPIMDVECSIYGEAKGGQSGDY